MWLLGWVQLDVLRNNPRVHVIAALDRAVAAIPYDIAIGRTALSCNNTITSEVVLPCKDSDCR